MAIFNSYIKLPEGKSHIFQSWFAMIPPWTAAHVAQKNDHCSACHSGYFLDNGECKAPESNWGFPKRGVPQTRWMMSWKFGPMMDWGTTSILGNLPSGSHVFFVTSRHIASSE
jgi:hypothetical protein